MGEKVFTIDNVIFIIAIAILTFWLTFVTAKGGLTNHRYTLQWWKRITNRGKIAGFILIVLPIVLVFQEANNQRISHNSNIDLKNAQDSSAEFITQGVKKGVKIETDVLFENLSIAFKKQGLQYDSIKKQVLYIKDSIRSNNASIIPPLLRIRNLEFKDSSATTRRNTILYEIISDNAVSYKCDLKFDIFGITTNVTPTSIDFNLRAIYKNITIAKDQRISAYLSFIDNFHCNTYILRLKGSYYSSDKKLITIDELYLLRNNGEKFVFELPAEFHDKVFRDYIKENKF